MIILLFYILIVIITTLLLLINIIFAPHKPYKEKDSPFECGFHSFMGQNRTQFNISFFVFGILFLIFDIEIAVIYPILPTIYNNELLGLIFVEIFFLLLALGFAFELGKNALTMHSRQNYVKTYKNVLNSLKDTNKIVLSLTVILFKLFAVYFVLHTITLNAPLEAESLIVPQYVCQLEESTKLNEFLSSQLSNNYQGKKLSIYHITTSIDSIWEKRYFNFAKLAYYSCDPTTKNILASNFMNIKHDDIYITNIDVKDIALKAHVKTLIILGLALTVHFWLGGNILNFV